MQLCQHFDGAVLQFALTFDGCVGEPVIAEGVGHDVGWYDAVDVVHYEKRCAQDLAGRFEPAHRRDGDVGDFADFPDHFELMVESIGGEDLHIFGGRGHAGHQLLLDGLSVLMPAGGQDDGFRRHARRVDAAFDGDLRCRAVGQDGRQPLRHHRWQGRDVSAGSLKVLDVVDGGVRGHGCLHSLRLMRGNYDTVGSVMKADPPTLDKASGAGRPRDPRIDSAILSATAELLVEIGYSNLSLAAVAERAGTTKSALYRRWSSKAELVHEAAFPVAPSALEAPAGDFAADIRMMIEATRDVFTTPVVRAALPGLVADMTADPELNARVLARSPSYTPRWGCDCARPSTAGMPIPM